MRLSISLVLVFLVLAVFLVSGQAGCPEKQTTSSAVPAEDQEDVKEIVVVEDSGEGIPEPTEEEMEKTEDITEKEEIDESSTVTTHIIEYTNNGFSLSLLTIKIGDTVTFINKANENIWPASTIHPTHKTYPGSNINKCGTDEEKIIFDACGRVALGESYSFTFQSEGRWGYHNHLRPSKSGTIIVE